MARQAPTKKSPPPPARPKASPPSQAIEPTSLDDLPMVMTVELGRKQITLDDALQFGDQCLIELDRMVGEPVDVRINGELFARAEVVTVNERFGVRLTEVLSKAE